MVIEKLDRLIENIDKIYGSESHETRLAIKLLVTSIRAEISKEINKMQVDIDNYRQYVHVLERNK